MIDYCPYCNKETEIEKVVATETLAVRDEKIDVEVEYYKCHECCKEFEDMNSNVKPVEIAYRIYRERHGMLMPEEIVALRRRYGLFQRDLSAILGWGGATLSRYENGSLQDEAHDRMLHLVMAPSNLLDLIEHHPGNLSASIRERLIEKITSDIQASNPCDTFFHTLSVKDKPDIYSGWSKLNIEKLKHVILYFCESGMNKTIINKHLFYADFMFFRRQLVSITGARYAHATYGPVVDHYEHLLAMMIETDKSLAIEEESQGEHIALVHRAVELPDMEMFSGREIEVMEYIRNRFSRYGSKQISEFSHNEEGYKATAKGEFISYEYAASLKIEMD